MMPQTTTPQILGSHAWFDPLSLLIVVGGTLAATLLRCGWGDCRAALRAVRALAGQGFDAARVKGQLALQLREIQQDGFLRADAYHCGDAEFDALADLLIARRSLNALEDRHVAMEQARRARAQRDAQVFTQASELAPVLGLAGTLIALAGGGMAGGAQGSGDLATAIAMAVITTLYGLAAAHVLFAPLATAIARRGERETAERQEVFDWLAEGVRRAQHPPGAADMAGDRDADAPVRRRSMPKVVA